jgi:hypothetical protein
MRLTWVSGCAMVHSGPEPGAGMTAMVAKASGTAELAVVVTSHTLKLLPAMMNELADALTDRLPPRCNRVRLVAWNSGCLHDDRPAPAYQLASRLGVEVIAPAGPLLGVPGGSLFAPAGRGAQRPGGWWRFAPGSAPSRAGWRYPEPQWDADLGEVGEIGDDLVVEQVPAGLWLHRNGYRSVTDLVFSVPVDPADPALIVSHPSEAPLQRDDIARALHALPRRTLNRLVFTPYGPQPIADGRLGDVAAAALGSPARVRPGLPLYGSGGRRALVTVDSDGRPCWRPFARELRYRPHTACAEASDWANPVPGLLSPPDAPATFPLGSGWAAEVIEAGLWIRPAQSAEPADWARGLPLDADECTVVVGAPSTGHPEPPVELICDLLRNLPADARSRVRLAVHRDAAEDVLGLTASLCEDLPDDREVRVLGRAAQEPAPALTRHTPYPAQPAAPQPAPALTRHTPDPAHQPAPAAAHALRQPTPYPPQPAYQPAAQPARAADPVTQRPAREAPEPTHALRQPTPYPAQPAYQPATPPGFQAAPPPGFQPTPPPVHAARTIPAPAHGDRTGSLPANGDRTIAPPPHGVHQPTPPPSAAVRPVTQRAGTHEAAETATQVHALRQPTPYPAQPAYQPTPPSVHGDPAHVPSAPYGEPAATVPPARGGRTVTPPPVRGGRTAAQPPAQGSYQPTPPPAPIAHQAPPAPAYEARPAAPRPVHDTADAATQVHALRQPTPYPAQPAYQPTPPSAPGAHYGRPAPAQAARPVTPPTPADGRIGISPAARGGRAVGRPAQDGGHAVARPTQVGGHQQPTPPVTHPVRQPTPHPAQPAYQQPAPAQPAYQQPAPAQPAYQQPAPAQPGPSPEDSQALPRGEIRSHRTAAKPSRGAREDDKATTSELNRLLGFFDEIRKARAWDEEPAGTAPGAS